MRIISGKLKGHKLLTFKADHIRPTTDRVKETIFNILQFDIPDARVLDLFSGTGCLAIESYSREAKEVIAVEKHPQSIKIIQDNLKHLKISSTSISVVKQDAFKFILDYKAKPFDIVFIDPPFTEALAHKVMQQMSKSSVIHGDSKIIIESAKKEHLEDTYDSLRLIDRRLFGDKVMSIFSRKPDEANNLPG